MNKVSYTEEPIDGGDGYNQSPSPNSNALTTNQDFNGVVNSRAVRSDASWALSDAGLNSSGQIDGDHLIEPDDHGKVMNRLATRSLDRGQPSSGDLQTSADAYPPPASVGEDPDRDTAFQRLKKKVITVASFVGPGFMISVAYSMLSLPFPTSST
jgi:metal iron transporter